MKIALAVSSMRDHMTDEGWQLTAGLEFAGYTLFGSGYQNDETDVVKILDRVNPDTVVIQDKREWDVRPRDFRDKTAFFHNIAALKNHPSFKVTVLKDAQNNPSYHNQSAKEMGADAWIVYYHPDIVFQIAPYLRRDRLIRTYHTVDRYKVPQYEYRDPGCLISGAVSGAYPLRRRLVNEVRELPLTTVLHHPGYHRTGCHTPDYLRRLSDFQVAICTASMYGYALRKIIEATACGCIVVTDLPKLDCLPEIDGNLVRISPRATTKEVGVLLKNLYESYDAKKQENFANLAKDYYDYRVAGDRLYKDIEDMRNAVHE